MVDHKDGNDRRLAVYCDFENIALGARDAHYAKFNIDYILERLLVKGSIVVKKAYCDWERYKTFKAPMHEAAFELIDIPHVRQSGKNSADIRMVVDALDLCYTKTHVDTFVIISGDSDFSPLVSKLRENAHTVIGVGVKNSTSDLLISNCDEFIYYDDLVREREKTRKTRQRKSRAKKKPATTTEVAEADAAEAAAASEAAEASDPPKKKRGRKKAASRKRAAAATTDTVATVEESDAVTTEADADAEELVQEGLDLMLETAATLFAEREGSDKLWGSMIKQALKRRRPGFNESYYGFSSFGKMLEEASDRGFLELEHDDRSGGYTIRAIHV